MEYIYIFNMGNTNLLIRQRSIWETTLNHLPIILYTSDIYLIFFSLNMMSERRKVYEKKLYTMIIFTLYNLNFRIKI